ncbi:MAG: glycine/sarcosine/betaine reductase selenoprotein B family protein [Candidatus Sulfobium sp.]|jgi:D-proline reductase (dithiol) PrdB
MIEPARLKNRFIARILGKFPFLEKIFTSLYYPEESEGVPWTPVKKPLKESKIAIVTTAGVHHRDQTPFDMTDPDGDPSYRILDVRKPIGDFVITHDYYDHTDADRDLNIVFPVDRLREFEEASIIGRLADTHYGFMGHVAGRHIDTLVRKKAPEVAGMLKSDGVDAVLLTPA